MSSAIELTEEQRRAVERRGRVFVSAGAGTGKTRVLVERYLYDIIELGLGIEQIVAITYTNRAAGELTDRIRRRIAELPREDVRTRELERRLPGAWISTIHDLCGRLLRRYGMRIGVPPGYELIDETTASLLLADAFVTARDGFLRGATEHVDLVLDYDRSLEELASGVLRASRRAGKPIALRPQGPSGFPVAFDEALEALRSLAADPAVKAERREDADELASLLTHDRDPRAYAQAESDFKLAGVESWKAPLLRLQSAARAEIAEQVCGPLQEFVEAVADRYRELKARQALLDFDDLLLNARRLLLEHESVRRSVVEQFRDVMVDEFQDANDLQTEIVGLISGQSLTPEGLEPATVFFVGDEQQSIYRFQAADVEVFRRLRSEVAATSDPIPLQRNYRSAPAILNTVNRIFGGRLGPSYQPLLPAIADSGDAVAEPAADPVVELIAVETTRTPGEDGHGRSVAEGRRLEAGRVAQRIAAAVAEGTAQSDVVVLLSASTDAELYAGALAERGLTPLALLGRGFFGTDVVRDVQAYLSLLRNGADDLALVSVLASPLIGASNDALYALQRTREAARTRDGQRLAVPLLEVVGERIPGLDHVDAAALTRFAEIHLELRRASTTSSLAELVRLVVRAHDYDVALLSRSDGEQALANLEKLIALARGFERTHGPDLEGFCEAIAARGREDREGVALTADESVDAVRLMTIHASKGLEFPFVVFADAGRPPRTADAHVIASLAGQIAFKVPGAGKLARTRAFDDLLEAERQATSEEAWRKIYVALTRAAERLLISGTVTRKDDAWEGPLADILGYLGVSEPRAGRSEVATETGVIVVEGIPLGSEAAEEDDAPAEPGEVDQNDATDARVDPETRPGDGDQAQGLLFDPTEIAVESAPGPATAVAVAPLAPLSVGARVRSLTVAAVEDLRRCPRQYEAKRLQGFREFALPTTAARPAATAIGTRVHRLAERLGRDGLDGAELELAVEAEFGDESPALRRQAAGWLRAWTASPVQQRLARLGARQELELAVEIGGVVISGRFDAFARDGDRALIVDLKTTRLEGRTPDQVADDEYWVQRAIYALAALDSGLREAELAFVFLSGEEALVSTRLYRAEDRPDLLASVESIVALANARTFPAHPRAVAACGRCPVFRVVCPGAEVL